MKEITSTSFGLIIANILPGLVAVFSLSHYIEPLNAFFVLSSSNILVITILSLILGLEITLFRWLIYEVIICFKCKINKDNFKMVTNIEKLTILKVLAEEYYRYHQFWGNMSIVIPFFYISCFRNDGVLSNVSNSFWWLLVFELITIAGAVVAYMNYVGSFNKTLEV